MARTDNESPKEVEIIEQAPPSTNSDVIGTGKAAAIQAEVNASKERAIIPLEERVTMFKNMLNEKEVIFYIDPSLNIINSLKIISLNFILIDNLFKQIYNRKYKYLLTIIYIIKINKELFTVTVKIIYNRNKLFKVEINEK